MRAKLLLLSLAVALPAAVVCQTAVTIVVGTTQTGTSPNIVGVNMGARARVRRHERVSVRANARRRM
jgi:hypothetical protein